MRLAQAQLLVHFQVHLDEQPPVELMGGKFVDGQALALRRRADGVEQVLARLGPRLHVHHHVGGHDLADAALDGVADRVHLLEARGARHADGDVHEMPIARRAARAPVRPKARLRAPAPRARRAPASPAARCPAGRPPCACPAARPPR